MSRDDALEELRRVLAYRQFGQDHETQQALLVAYRDALWHCLAQGPAAVDLPSCRDRDDQKFLEIAASCSPCTLVTRDRDLLRLGRIDWCGTLRHPAAWRSGSDLAQNDLLTMFDDRKPLRESRIG